VSHLLPPTDHLIAAHSFGVAAIKVRKKDPHPIKLVFFTRFCRQNLER